MDGATYQAKKSPPTILFVHGAWHFPGHYKRQLEVFESAGFPTSCPTLPSFGALPPTGIPEDADCVSKELEKLVDIEHKEVIVIGHSYGGVVITQAIDAEFGLLQRKKKGLEGGVVGLLYCTAFVLLVGETLGSALGGGPPPDTKLPPFIPVDDDGMCEMLDPEKRFYHDLPAGEQKHWVSFLKKCPATAQLQPITYAAYLHHPATYLICEDDQALPAFLQRKMIGDVENGSDAKFKIETCDAGHSPFLSQPHVLLNIVTKMAGS